MFERFKQEIIAHAEDAFPEECLGVIIDDRYVRLQNVSPTPETNFEMSLEDEDRYGFSGQGDKPQAVVHSHPDGPLYPTYTDMVAQIAGEVPFVMVAHDERIGWDFFEFGDHILDLPLEERVFRHGCTDCFGAERAWFWQKWGVKFPDIPRRDGWWEPVLADPDDPESEVLERPANLYADYFKEWGFVQLTADQIEAGLQVGDVFFYKLHRGNTLAKARSLETHGGVYVGDGRIYHHLPNRLSVIEAGEGWARKASRWVRHRYAVDGKLVIPEGGKLFG